MKIEWLLTLSPLIGLAINVVGQVTSVHLFHRVSLSILAGLVIGLGGTIFIYYLLSDKAFFPIGMGCTSVLTYLSLSFCYWAFLNLNITSLRIRMARELLSNNLLQTKDLLRQYSPQELFNRRIQRLETAGHIKNLSGKWTLLSKKLLIFIIVSSNLRKLIIPSKSINA